MRLRDPLIAHLLELLAPLGRASARAMFGGSGLYLDAVIIGIVADGRCYLKVDAESRSRFAAAGSSPFVYHSRNGAVAMSYWSLPEAALDAADAMAPWARLALAAALRQRSPRPRKRSQPGKGKPRSLGTAGKA